MGWLEEEFDKLAIKKMQRECPHDITQDICAVTTPVPLIRFCIQCGKSVPIEASESHPGSPKPDGNSSIHRDREEK